MKTMIKLSIVLICIGMIWMMYIHHQPMIEKHFLPSSIEVEVLRKNGVEKIDLNTYLIGVLGSEMSPTYEMEALKAQCVAARTFVASRNFQVDDTTNTQVYRDASQLKEAWGSKYQKYYQRLEKAVMETQDEVLTYQGSYISALFYAQSCGKSANAIEYFGNEVPYLQSVDSSSDCDESDHIDEVYVDVETLMQKLNLDEPPLSIEVPIRYDSGYVKSWNINHQSFSGREIREAFSLRSSAFEVTFDGQQFTFITKGYGHGVGMSQRGANAMAKKGSSYREILHHYYTDVEMNHLLE